MSRYSDEYDGDEPYPNSGELWWANVRRALRGRRGQRDLRELERALLALPQKRLVEGYLAKGGDVCAVGALVVQRRVSRGEGREQVLAELEAAYPVQCGCWHPKGEHAGGTGACAACALTADRAAHAAAAGNPWHWTPRRCEAFAEDPDGTEADEGDATAAAGRDVGMTYSLAWRLGQLNDIDFGALSPEDRYTRVLEWVRENITTEAVPA